MFMMPTMHNIHKGLYLGNMRASKDLEKLTENKITHILVVGVELNKSFPDKFKYHHIEIDDGEFDDLLSHLPACLNFIDEALKNPDANVLVHCFAGISRSSSVVIAYLMYKNKWNYKEAYQFTKSKREIISPNDGFKAQLKVFHKLEYTADPSHPEIVEHWAKMTKVGKFTF